MVFQQRKQQGYTLVEMTLALLLAAILMLGMDGLLNTALQSKQLVSTQNKTIQSARFAMQQMLTAALKTRRLMIPLGENSATAWSESVRDVLAVTLDPTEDKNKDGWADANNDKDYLDINNNGSRDIDEPERVDEDTQGDTTNDAASGIHLIDDNGDGTVDNGLDFSDDDEDGVSEDDPINNLDDDNDGAIDEDSAVDMQSDSAPGIAGVDDNYNGIIDDGFNNGDDDEDGTKDEDWFDAVVFFLNGTTLMQRIPNLNPSDGADYSEYPIVEEVSQFRVERLLGQDGKTVLVDITLELTPADAEAVSLNARVRIGGGL